MAQDIRELLKKDASISKEKMPAGHQKRFLEKLEESIPQKPKNDYSYWWKIAASVVVFLGLGYAAFQLKGNQPVEVIEDSPQEMAQLKTLGDISPDLKKVEDYYLASINLELAKMPVNDDNKELVDSYIAKLEKLNEEYKKLSLELTENGPSELTINALIDNLKMRLNLLQRLREQLKDLSSDEEEQVIS